MRYCCLGICVHLSSVGKDSRNVCYHTMTAMFLHTWDETDHNTKSWHNRTAVPANVDAEMLERLRICYKPKDMLVEHQEPIKEEDYTFLIAPYTTVSNAGMHFMFESMSKANQLRKAYEKHLNFSYDLVVVTRPDILLIHPLDLEATLWQAQICGYDLEHTRFFASLPGSTKKIQHVLLLTKAMICCFLPGRM